MKQDGQLINTFAIRDGLRKAGIKQNVQEKPQLESFYKNSGKHNGG